MTSRPAAVAGRFYPGDPRRIRADLAHLLAARKEPTEPAIALVAPHAGWVYSGRVAAAVYGSCRIPPSVIVLCPNHTGRGPRRSLWARGSWQLPNGTVPIDEELAESALRCTRLDADQQAHAREHAIEVQLPFLLELCPSLRVVPICLGPQTLDECRELGDGLARAISETAAPNETLIVASTDMSHYVPANVAKRMDTMAIERVLALDPEGLYDVVTRHDISMCGFIPTCVTLFAARGLGATRAELVAYANSGEVSGDFDQVVGYAGIVVR